MLGSFQIVAVYPTPPHPPIAIDLFVRLWEHVIIDWAPLPASARLPVVPRPLTMGITHCGISQYGITFCSVMCFFSMVNSRKTNTRCVTAGPMGITSMVLLRGGYFTISYLSFQ